MEIRYVPPTYPMLNLISSKGKPIAALLVLVPKHSMSIPDDRTLQLVRKTKKVGTLTNLRACMDVTLAIVSARARYCDCHDYECMQVRECEYCI
jgi:hypothetical protein